MIEDLISTGDLSVTAVEAFKTSRCRSIRCCSYLYLRFEKADDTFSNIQLPFYTLSDYNELIEVAENEGEISSEDIQTLVEWRDNLA